MISRTTHLTAAAWRNLVHTCIEDGDMQTIMSRLIEAAKGGDQGAIEVVLRYTAGTPYKCPTPVEPLELDTPTDLDGCVVALGHVLEAEASNRIGREQARSYRESILAVAQVLRASEAQTDMAEALLARGSTIVYPEAGGDPADALRRAFEAQSSDN